MKKIILQLSVVVLILSGCGSPDSSSQLTENKPVKIGYESDDNGSYDQ